MIDDLEDAVRRPHGDGLHRSTRYSPFQYAFCPT